jgi:putative ABC transport system permease protein
MRASIRLAVRNAWAGRRRQLLTSLAVVLAVGFMSGVLMLSGGLGGHTTNGLPVAYRDIPLVVHGPQVSTNPPGEFITQAGAPVPAAALAAVQGVPGVRQAVGLRSGFAVTERADGHVIGSPGTGGGVGQSWIGDPALNPYHLVRGQAPVSADQVVIDQAAASHSHVHVGQSVILVTATGRRSVTVVGIAGLGNATGPFDTTIVLLAPGSAQALLGGGDVFDQLLVSAPSTSTSAVAAAVQPWHAEAVTGPAWAAGQKSLINTSLSFERIFLLGFAVIALIAGGTLISNTFTVLVAQRSREQALARALGSTRRQVLVAVLAEAAAVGLVASVVGAAAGVGVAALVRQVFQLLGLSLFSTHASVSITSLAVPVVIGLATTVVAAVGPARRASAVPPVAALRRQQVDESGHSWSRSATGVALLGIGAVGIVGAASTKSSALAGIGVAVLLIGSVVAGPVLVAWLSAVLTRPFRAVLGPPGALSARGLGRNPRRSAATANALMIGVLLVASVTTIVASVNKGTASPAANGIRANYVVSTASTWRPQVTPSVINRVAAAPHVTTTSPIYAGPARYHRSVVRVGTVDPSTVSQVWDFGWTAGSLASLTGNQVAVQNSSLAGGRVGDLRTLTLPDGTTQTVQIAAVFTHGFVGFNAPVYLLPPTLFHAHEAAPGAQLLLVNADHGANVNQIKAALGGDRSVTVQTAKGWVGQGNIKVKQLGNLFYALDALAVLIAFIGVTNTMALAVRERRVELGILRALGALPGQLARMIGLETVVLACYGTVVGAGLGVLGCWALTRSSTSTDLSQFSLPVTSLELIVAGAVLVSIVLAIVPARMAQRAPILEAITME